MYQIHLIEVDPRRMKFNPRNPRKHRGKEYERLRENIKHVGILQPPIVRDLPGGFYEVIDGEGRTSVAQELDFEKIWVLCMPVRNEHETLMMLQSANAVRSFHFLAECRGLANLHRRGSTNEQLAEQFSVNLTRMTEMVAIGYFPDDLFSFIQKTIDDLEEDPRWGFLFFATLLPLREAIPGQCLPGGKWCCLDGIYNYAEIYRAIEQIKTRKIKNVEDVHTYVLGRKAQIYQERFNQDLQQRLEEELTHIRADLEIAKQQQIDEMREKTEQKYQGQIDLLQEQKARTVHHYQQQIRILEAQQQELLKAQSIREKQVVKRPEKIEEMERTLQEQLQKVQADRQVLRQDQQRWEEQKQLQEVQALQEARRRQQQWEQAQLEAQLKERQNREQWEKDQRKKLEQELVVQKQEMDEKLKKSEEDLKAYYEEKSNITHLKAENTIRGLLSYGIKSLAETQQTIDHIVSADMLPHVLSLGGVHTESLVSAIRSMKEALIQAEEKLIYGDTLSHVESGGMNEHSSSEEEHNQQWQHQIPQKLLQRAEDRRIS